MSSKMMALSNLRAVLDRVFGSNDPAFDAVRQSMSYQFRPEATSVKVGSLGFDVILNAGRLEYVQQILAAKAKADRAEGKSAPQSPVASIPLQAKKSSAPHSPPPGQATCPFDDIATSPLVLGEFTLQDQAYLPVVNKRPWSHWHFMLVSERQKPQAITQQHLLAALELVASLGDEFEGMFNGVAAAASVYHNTCNAIADDPRSGTTWSVAPLHAVCSIDRRP